jgi:hypothetical protein
VSELSQDTERLVRLLQEQTESGRRSWEEGSADTEFVFVHDAGSVVILRKAGDGTAPFELRILDPSGTPVESYESSGTGAEMLSDLYEVARRSSIKPGRVVETLLAELGRTPGEEVQELMDSTVERVKATPNKEEKVEIIKPLLLRRLEDLRERGQTTLKWPALIEPFPSGGGVRNALTKAFRDLRQSGEITCTVDPEPGPGQGFAGGKVIRLES